MGKLRYPVRALMIVAALGLASPAARAAEHDSLAVYVIGERDVVGAALGIGGLTHVVDDLTHAHAVVVNNTSLAPGESERIGAAVRAGVGLVVFVGDAVSADMLADLGVEGVTLQPANRLVTFAPHPEAGPIAAAINWRAAPQVGLYTALSGAGLSPLVAAGNTSEGALIAEGRLGQGRLFLVGPSLSDPANRSFTEWFYFNYLLYYLASASADRQPVSFAEYPGAPVPHGPLKAVVLVLVSLMLLSTLTAFYFVRRYSMRHPESLERMVVDVSRFRRREGGSDWERVGFHRGIASLMIAILNNIWLFVPISILINVVLFGIILPSAQVRGMVSLVGMFFGTVWILLDWGTAVAGQKFLSEYRVNNPTEGIKYVQFFVWWQAITGTIQVCGIALFALYYLPHTANAYLSIYVLFHVLIQFPGFQIVFEGIALPGLQRFDYQRLIGTIVAFIGPAFQIGSCLLMVSWGKNNPVYAPIAGALGLGLGELLRLASVFVVGFILYRRLGLSARVVFLAHFDFHVVKKALIFGIPITLIGVFYFGAYTLQVWLLTRLVLNYTEIQANLDVALMMVASVPNIGPYVAIFVFAASFISSFSEAFSHGKLGLCRYYNTACLKWGQFLAMFLMAVLLAVGDRFILGSLPADQYTRGIVWMRIFAVLWLFSPVIWVSDSILVGIGKPHLQMWSMIAEQSVRIICLLLLAKPFQATGIIIAYCVSIPIKAFIDVIFVRKYLGGLTINWWQSFVAPLFSAAIICVLLRYVGGLYWTPYWVPSSILLAAGLVAAMPFHFFLSALFGGWDDDGMDEFRRAVPLSNVAMPIAWLFLKFAEAGCRISPLHGQFPIRNYEQGILEADELTREKVRLEDFSVEREPSADA